MKRVALVTGGSSGIGLSALKSLSASGFIVYELSRKGVSTEYATHITCDVTDEAQVTAAINEVLNCENRLDLVVNCAGFGISGAIEFSELPDAKAMFDADYFGTVNVNNAVIPHMRNRKSGRIINVSSVAAVASIPFQAHYSAAKAAVNSYTLSLANELRPFGISVCALMPGDVKTGFTAARMKIHRGDDIYGGRISSSVSKMEKDEQNGIPSDAVGALICKIANKKHIRPMYVTGFFYKCAVALIKLLPYKLVNYILYLMYAK